MNGAETITNQHKTIKMKLYRLKKEAIPFFKKDLSTYINTMEFWSGKNIDPVALEEVEEAYIKCGIQTSDVSTSMCGWSLEKGANFHFTIVFPSMKIVEYDKFNQGRITRDLMGKMQVLINQFHKEFYNRPSE